MDGNVALVEAVEAVRGAVAALEGAAAHAQGAIKGTQRDMFGAPGGAAPEDARAGALAALDRAIAGVEGVLGEDAQK